MANSDEIIARAQDVSGTLTPPEVGVRMSELLGHMENTALINLSPISNPEKFDGDRLAKYWAAFAVLLPPKTVEDVILPDSRPTLYAIKGNTGKLCWHLHMNLHANRKMPLVIFNSFHEAGRRIGYNPFRVTFNTEVPFAEAWANAFVGK